MLLNILATMRRITERIESMPLLLSLPIIRLDDALGTSLALPFQACSGYTVLKPARRYCRILTAVDVQKCPRSSEFPKQPPRVASGPIGYVRPFVSSVEEHNQHARMVSDCEARYSYSVGDDHCEF